MLFRTRDLLNKPVTVGTVIDPHPNGWMTVLDVSGAYLVLENNPGEMVVIPWTSITRVAIDYSAAREEGWFDLPENNTAFVEARRSLFEAERAPLVGLTEDKIDELALKAELSFRRFRRSFPDAKFARKLYDRALKAAIGPVNPNQDESVTGGALDTVNYRRAVFHREKMKAAMSARKPEEEVAPSLIGMALHAGNALATYPAHAELREWFNNAENIRQKLTPDTCRNFDLESPFVAGDVALKSNLYI